ncbi:isoflavone reductase family protein-like protein CipA [Mollisia scopiformis]|uniref:Isoflavone reductase family protein-like protein CipA n=1 Tax=Mollisia scopiformis TaxID=149040 RepID=A0A194XCQ9_MOLSC|nr:isoflavone reductase family protein-like protein CipA [Mollisia scopiformis]KUJ17542.1 isoflavone reductase family protein-like protein CipA [Mollisia scopiformis]
MVSIKNVAIVGASGSLGAPILKVILDSAKFNITVVSREGSKATFPSSVKVVKADYNSLDSLTSAFKGQDAVVSTVGTEGLLGQSVLIDAAIAAGVKRFLPSEFGSDLSNPNVAKLPVFGYKLATRKHLEEKIQAGADITYTYVINGGFLDWGLEVGFLLNTKEGKPTLYNGGDRQFSTTTLASVGQAVVGVLTHYEETKNRPVYIQSRTISQNHLLELAKKVAPEKKFEPVVASTDDMKKSSDEKLAKGEVTMPVMVGYIFVSIFDEAYGGRFVKLDNELLGVPEASDAEVEAILKKVLA